MNLEQFEDFEKKLGELLAEYNVCIYYDEDTKEYIVDSNTENTPWLLSSNRVIK
jgi:broad-specificity NMP kinase